MQRHKACPAFSVPFLIRPLAVLLNFFIGVMASTLPAMFPTHIRYSALASAFNISVLIAGLTPTIAAWLVESTKDLYMPAYYLMVISTRKLPSCKPSARVWPNSIPILIERRSILLGYCSATANYSLGDKFDAIK
ncbi:Proline/betaine transporter [Pseudomonas putida]|uniref:Proline/betaine transporter n=1 Tax=Pseudomonas putida TaxID=303 RepID=A0A1B2F6C6_PSEPU|nr:Proline/betaine transporter [Pseudomonas putida]